MNGATAHPHYDPDGTSYNMGNSYGRKGPPVLASVLLAFARLCFHLQVWLTGARYNIIRVPPEKSEAAQTLHGAAVLCSIAPTHASRPSYYHSFGASRPPLTSGASPAAPPGQPADVALLLPAMSENYVVFVEQPIKMDLLNIATCRLRGKALCEGIYWDAGQDTVLHLVSKHTGEVRSRRCRRRRRLGPQRSC